MTFETKRQLALDILKLMFPDEVIVIIVAVGNDEGSMLHVGSTVDREGTKYVFRALLGQEEGCYDLS